jgi:hypothetical protein
VLEVFAELEKIPRDIRIEIIIAIVLSFIAD